MDVKLYTGTSSTQSITGLGFSPDLVWVKNRGSTNSHALFDSVRGAGYRLSSNETTAQVDNTAYFTAFTSDGFTVASNGGETNLSANTYVAWCWDESATPGFDIVTYTAGSAGTVAHNLGVAPKMILLKDRTTAANWYVWHTTLAANQFLLLNSTAATGTSSTIWNNTLPTSTVFGTDNWGTDNMVAYLWSEVAGFSKFGSYTGNGSTDGPFVFCGFRPKFVMIKGVTSSESGNADWHMQDSSRNTYNLSGSSQRLFANSSIAEATNPEYVLDFLSNGFKLRTGAANYGQNTSGNTYIFAAWAETPAKYALAR
jgi:hypothetical protein